MSDRGPYQIRLSERAEQVLRKLDKVIAKRIVRRLRWLAENVAEIVHQALKGQFSDYFRLRVGDYRIMYQLDHEQRLILVEEIGHRSDIYDQ